MTSSFWGLRIHTTNSWNLETTLSTVFQNKDQMQNPYKQLMGALIRNKSTTEPPP